MDSSVSSKDEIWFLRVCHHISNAVYMKLPLGFRGWTPLGIWKFLNVFMSRLWRAGCTVYLLECAACRTQPEIWLDVWWNVKHSFLYLTTLNHVCSECFFWLASVAVTWFGNEGLDCGLWGCLFWRGYFDDLEWLQAPFWDNSSNLVHCRFLFLSFHFKIHKRVSFDAAEEGFCQWIVKLSHCDSPIIFFLAVRKVTLAT
jgi:hypothetical protein